jgi:hypothetical protein
MDKYALNVAALNRGRQIGKSGYILREGQRFFLEVALQKINEKYMVYVAEIQEEKMTMDEYDYEEVTIYTTLEAAIEQVESKTIHKFSDLAPCKGQRIFNPSFYSEKAGL